jgi:glucose-6-phosphate 1-dehydrogenase
VESPTVDTGSAGSNSLVLRIRPDAGLTIRLGTKVPNTQTEVRDVVVDFSHGHSFAEAVPEAYEQELADVLLGSQAYFPSSLELAEAWRVTEPVLAAWRAEQAGPETYQPGSWGPAAANRLLAQDGRRWRRP